MAAQTSGQAHRSLFPAPTRSGEMLGLGGLLRGYPLLHKIASFSRIFISSSPCKVEPHMGLDGDVPPDVEFGVAAAPWPA